MPQISYQDFDVVIARLDETRRKYSVTVQGSPGGDASGDFAVRELLIKTSAISLTVEHSELTVRRNASLMNGSATNGMPLSRVFPPSSDDAKKLGTLLFDTLFKTEVRDAYNRSLGAVRGHSSSEKKLRLRLNLTAAPELAILPWEYIRDPVSSHFLSQLPDTPVVRYVNSDRPVPESLSVEAPLRLLVATSSPPGLPKLDTRAELDRLRNALQHLVDKELIEIHCLENTSLSALCNKLSECDYHILHYVGHGDYDNGSGVLLFEAEQGENEAEPDKNQERTPHRVDGSTLALKLAGFGSLRLAIINACEGASASENNCYDGVAQNLLRHGNLPAVIAMQFAITDGAAIRFAAGFYKWLARQFPVEHALAMTRGEMIVSDTDVEWATPVLFMRAKDGNLFNLNEKLPPPIPLEPSPVDPYCTSIVQAFRDGQLVFFLGLEVNLYGRQECIRNWQPGDTLPSNWELATYLTNTLELGEDEGLGVAGVSQRAFVERKKRDLSRLLRRVFTDGRADPLAPASLY